MILETHRRKASISTDRKEKEVSIKTVSKKSVNQREPEHRHFQGEETAREEGTIVAVRVHEGQSEEKKLRYGEKGRKFN